MTIELAGAVYTVVDSKYIYKLNNDTGADELVCTIAGSIGKEIELFPKYYISPDSLVPTIYFISMYGYDLLKFDCSLNKLTLVHNTEPLQYRYENSGITKIKYFEFRNNHLYIKTTGNLVYMSKAKAEMVSSVPSFLEDSKKPLSDGATTVIMPHYGEVIDGSRVKLIDVTPNNIVTIELNGYWGLDNSDENSATKTTLTVVFPKGSIVTQEVDNGQAPLNFISPSKVRTGNITVIAEVTGYPAVKFYHYLDLGCLPLGYEITSDNRYKYLDYSQDNFVLGKSAGGTFYNYFIFRSRYENLNIHNQGVRLGDGWSIYEPERFDLITSKPNPLYSFEEFPECDRYKVFRTTPPTPTNYIYEPIGKNLEYISGSSKYPYISVTVYFYYNYAKTQENGSISHISLFQTAKIGSVSVVDGRFSIPTSLFIPPKIPPYGDGYEIDNITYEYYTIDYYPISFSAKIEYGNIVVSSSHRISAYAEGKAPVFDYNGVQTGETVMLQTNASAISPAVPNRSDSFIGNRLSPPSAGSDGVAIINMSLGYWANVTNLNVIVTAGNSAIGSIPLSFNYLEHYENNANFSFSDSYSSSTVLPLSGELMSHKFNTFRIDSKKKLVATSSLVENIGDGKLYLYHPLAKMIVEFSPDNRFLEVSLVKTDEGFLDSSPFPYYPLRSIDVKEVGIIEVDDVQFVLS